MSKDEYELSDLMADFDAQFCKDVERYLMDRWNVCITKYALSGGNFEDIGRRAGKRSHSIYDALVHSCSIEDIVVKYGVHSTQNIDEVKQCFVSYLDDGLLRDLYEWEGYDLINKRTKSIIRISY